MIRIGRFLDIEKIVKLDLRVSEISKVSSVMCNFSGVYVIFNKITGEYYIGSSKNIMRRLREHIKRPKGLLKENFSKYDRFLDYEYILPIQKYSDISKISYYRFVVGSESMNAILAKTIVYFVCFLFIINFVF